jgi:hypothetical protein
MKSLQHVLRCHLTIAYIRDARIIVLRKKREQQAIDVARMHTIGHCTSEARG